MAQRVSTGLFFNFTKSELDEVSSALRTKLIDGGPDAVTSVNVGGQAFSFGPRSGLTLDRFQAELQNAYNQLDPGSYSNRIVNATQAGFRGTPGAVGVPY